MQRNLQTFFFLGFRGAVSKITAGSQKVCDATEARDGRFKKVEDVSLLRSGQNEGSFQGIEMQLFSINEKS